MIALCFDLRFRNGEIDHPVHEVEAQEGDREDNPRIFVDVASLHTKESFWRGLEGHWGWGMGSVPTRRAASCKNTEISLGGVGEEVDDMKKLLAGKEGSRSNVPPQQQQKSPTMGLRNSSN